MALTPWANNTDNSTMNSSAFTLENLGHDRIQMPGIVREYGQPKFDGASCIGTIDGTDPHHGTAPAGTALDLPGLETTP